MRVLRNDSFAQEFGSYQGIASAMPKIVAERKTALAAAGRVQRLKPNS